MGNPAETEQEVTKALQENYAISAGGDAQDCRVALRILRPPSQLHLHSYGRGACPFSDPESRSNPNTPTPSVLPT
jgi:hypothetical protein